MEAEKSGTLLRFPTQFRLIFEPALLVLFSKIQLMIYY